MKTLSELIDEPLYPAPEFEGLTLVYQGVAEMPSADGVALADMWVDFPKRPAECTDVVVVFPTGVESWCSENSMSIDRGTLPPGLASAIKRWLVGRGIVAED